MAHVRKTTKELIAEEKIKAEQTKARLAKLEARDRSEDRAKDTHRKIVAGAILMAHVKIDPRFRKMVQDIFNKAVTNPKHRAVILDLIDEKAFNEAAEAQKKTALDASAGPDTHPAAPARPHQQAETGQRQGPAPRLDF